MTNNKYTPHNKTSMSQSENRQKLVELYKSSPLSIEERLINFGLYMRSSAMAKILFWDEAYKKIINLPGNIYVFGTWWGQDMTLLYNLRAVHEPYNFTRKVYGFDTFSGYPEISDMDVLSDTIKEGAYGTSEEYFSYFHELMQYHERENVMGHIRKYDLIQGNIVDTLPNHFHTNPHEIVSLAYIDLALYEPTKIVIDQCLKHMVKGSILVFDELNAAEYPGETIAVKESGILNSCEIVRSAVLPDRTFAIVK
jgi:hypothetical protein